MYLVVYGGKFLVWICAHEDNYHISRQDWWPLLNQFRDVMSFGLVRIKSIGSIMERSALMSFVFPSYLHWFNV